MDEEVLPVRQHRVVGEGKGETEDNVDDKKKDRKKRKKEKEKEKKVLFLVVWFASPLVIVVRR